jgi:hypothetical protein
MDIALFLSRLIKLLSALFLAPPSSLYLTVLKKQTVVGGDGGGAAPMSLIVNVGLP